MTPAAAIHVGDFVMFSDYLGDELGVVVDVSSDEAVDLPNSNGDWYKVVWCTNNDPDVELFHESVLLEWKGRYEQWKITTGNSE